MASLNLQCLCSFQPSVSLTSEENMVLNQLCIIVINVRRSSKRLELIQDQLKPLQLNVFRFEAVDAAQLRIIHTEQPKVKVINYNGRFFLLDYTRRSDFAKNGELPIGMTACSLSHLLVYQKIIECLAFEHYLILEDDATVLLEPDKMRKYLANLPSFYELVYLNSEAIWFPIIRSDPINGYYNKIMKRDFNCSVSYLVNKSTAAKLLSGAQFSVTRPPDDLLSNLFLDGKYGVIAPIEFLFGNNYDLESDCARFSSSYLSDI